MRSEDGARRLGVVVGGQEGVHSGGVAELHTGGVDDQALPSGVQECFDLRTEGGDIGVVEFAGHAQ